MEASVIYGPREDDRTSVVVVSITSSVLTATLMFMSQEGTQEFHVSDETGIHSDREMRALHPSCVREGDLVRAACHLVLRATVDGPPCYVLHLVSVDVLMVKPEESPDGSGSQT